MSLDDDTYERLVEEAASATPPVTLQQMIRFAVDGLLGEPRPPSPEWEDWAEMVAAHLRECPADHTDPALEREPEEQPYEVDTDEHPYDVDTDEAPAVEPARAAPETADLSTFRVAGVWFGLAVDRVEGIAARSEIQPLPTVRHGLMGAIRYRDALIAVFDAATVLGTAPLERDDAHHLVIRHDGALAALAVDEVGNLVQRTTGTWHPVPAGADELTRVGVTAIVDCGDRLVNVLHDLAL